MASQIEIRVVQEDDLFSLRDAINSVCSEKWYVATTEGFTLEQSRRFIEHNIENAYPQVVATVDDCVVGWCDVIPNRKVGFTHVGRLGMGVRKEYRRLGIGRRLLTECLRLSREYGLERVELEVFADNVAALKLYESSGFVTEGLKTNARKLEERYQDVVMMAMKLGSSA